MIFRVGCLYLLGFNLSGRLHSWSASLKLGLKLPRSFLKAAIALPILRPISGSFWGQKIKEPQP